MVHMRPYEHSTGLGRLHLCSYHAARCVPYMEQSPGTVMKEAGRLIYARCGQSDCGKAA